MIPAPLAVIGVILLALTGFVIVYISVAITRPSFNDCTWKGSVISMGTTVAGLVLIFSPLLYMKSVLGNITDARGVASMDENLFGYSIISGLVLGFLLVAFIFVAIDQDERRACARRRNEYSTSQFRKAKLLHGFVAVACIIPFVFLTVHTFAENSTLTAPITETKTSDLANLSEIPGETVLVRGEAYGGKEYLTVVNSNESKLTTIDQWTDFGITYIKDGSPRVETTTTCTDTLHLGEIIEEAQSCEIDHVEFFVPLGSVMER